MTDEQAAGPILAELARLLDGLSEDRRAAGERTAELERERLNNPENLAGRQVAIRRETAQASLERVIRFIASPPVFGWRPDVMERSTFHHLDDLLEALVDLNAGARPDLLEPPPGPKVASPTEARFRGRVVAVVEVFVRAEVTVGEACAGVARDLDKLHYKRPYGRKKEDGENRIRAGTVREWRREVTKADKGTPIRNSFEEYLQVAEAYHADGVPYARLAARMLASLAQDVRGVRPFTTPTRRSSAEM